MGRYDGLSLFGLIMMLFLVPGFLCGGIWWLLHPVDFWQTVAAFVICVFLYFVFLAIEFVLLFIFGK